MVMPRTDLAGMLALVTVLLAPGIVAAEATPDSGAAGPASDAVSQSIRFYQRYLSGVRHVRCRFSPSCSQYALDAIAAYGRFGGVSRAADRLMRCNASAGSRYAHGDDGRLLDPARGEPPDPVALRTPSWLLPVEPESEVTSLASPGLEDSEAANSDAFAFGKMLAASGDCHRSETEFMRAAFLSGTSLALSAAHRASGQCWFDASEWTEAEEHFLAAAMLEGGAGRRIVQRAAAARFNAGDPAGAAGLLAEFAAPPTLVASTTATPDLPPDPDDEARALGLAGLCEMRRGRWSEAHASLVRGGELTTDQAMTERLEILAADAASGSEVRRARPGLASGLSAIVPGAGQIYAGRTQDGLRTLLVNGALIWTVAALAMNDQVPAAVLVGGITLPFYIGNITGAGASARMENRSRRSEYLARSLERAEAAGR
jgi:putative membrane protein insertion efficiency factor